MIRNIVLAVAHEWGHAMDFILADALGYDLSSPFGNNDIFKKIVQSMIYKR